MALESQPVPEVGPSIVPANSSRYTYSDGESFVTIAQKFGIDDPWDLIYFNFRTRDPREVNWYLKHYCGCNRQTADHYNYVFSSTDRRRNQPGYIFIPTTTLEMEPLEITARSGVRWGLGVKVNAGAGAEIMSVYGYLFSQDRYSDKFLLFLDGATVDVGSNFSAGAVAIIAPGVYNPHELEGYIYDGGWEIQLQLGENWGKIWKFLKGTRKMGPLVKAFNQVAGHKMGVLIGTLRKAGKIGHGLGEAVRIAATLDKKQWEDIRLAVKMALNLEHNKYQDSPKLQVFDLPWLSEGVALGYSHSLAEAHILSVTMAP
jgi:hypothetical protein